MTPSVWQNKPRDSEGVEFSTGIIRLLQSRNIFPNERGVSLRLYPTLLNLTLSAFLRNFKCLRNLMKFKIKKGKTEALPIEGRTMSEFIWQSYLLGEEPNTENDLRTEHHFR